MSFFKKFFSKKKEEELDKGIEKTKTSFLSKMSKAIAGKSKVDIEVLDELEQVLISSDVGLDTTIKIIDRIEARVERDKYINTSELNSILRDEIVQLLSENNTKDLTGYDPPGESMPSIILVVGVNGVGKTTTIGKIANQYVKQGRKVVLGAGDTFRAAAVDQLGIWAERVGCDFFNKGMHTDPAAVAYETVKYAIDNDCDVAIIDTAGRLHTKKHLMSELTKIKRSIGKKMASAPHEVLLVLDANGTAKGGVAIGISDQFKVPIKYLGVGEGIEQIQIFNKRAFVDSLFKEHEQFAK